MTISCARCNASVDFHLSNCPSCDLFIGYPNVRKAMDMKGDLDRNYAGVIREAAGRGAKNQVDKLEAILAATVATINVRPSILLNMALGISYRNYYKALDQKLRNIAEERYHAHRAAVDAKIHPGYGQEIVNAALSPDGRGLENYGEVTLQLREVSIGARSSVLRENAFAFYERNDLGKRDAEETPGWRSIWAERARLGVAHLGEAITTATADAELPSRVMAAGADRDSDQFLEVHIYGDITCLAISNASLDHPLTTSEARVDWEASGQKLARQGVSVRERVRP